MIKKVKIERLRHIPLVFKLIYLVLGGGIFFVLFPFLLRYGSIVYIAFFILLLVFGLLFRMVTNRKTFRITLWLWVTGSILYILVAIFFVIKGMQPLPYMHMERLAMILYYFSYPFRILGIFFTGLTFVEITSPVEFIRWGKAGLSLALAYRAFEYSIASFNENRIALMIQGNWPDSADRVHKFRLFIQIVRYAPVLIATTFRNLILWSPWAWICYTSIKKDIERRFKK